MTLTIKQVRAAMENAHRESKCKVTDQAIDAFLNSISDLVDSDKMDLAELLVVFASDVRVYETIAILKK